MIEPVMLGFFQEMQFVIQIFIMISIISFILNHLGKGLPSIVIILVMFYVVFFIIPGVAELAFLMYTLLMAGISTLFVDFFFITAQQPQQQEGERPDVTGTDVGERKRALEHARHASHQAVGMVQNMMRRGR